MLNPMDARLNLLMLIQITWNLGNDFVVYITASINHGVWLKYVLK